jgi:hypothetical protein
MDWKDNINTIKEIFPGHFQIILDFATVDFLKYALSDAYQYVWVYRHETNDSMEWNSYELPLFNNADYHKIIARHIEFSFAVTTDEFKKLLPSVGPGIGLTQINKLPKHYLDPRRITGKTRYDLLLKDCDYLFEIDIPSPTDYGTIVSSNSDYLQLLLDNQSINWKDLP